VQVVVNGAGLGFFNFPISKNLAGDKAIKRTNTHTHTYTHTQMLAYAGPYTHFTPCLPVVAIIGHMHLGPNEQHAPAEHKDTAVVQDPYVVWRTYEHDAQAKIRKTMIRVQTCPCVRYGLHGIGQARSSNADISVSFCA